MAHLFNIGRHSWLVMLDTRLSESTFLACKWSFVGQNLRPKSNFQPTDLVEPTNVGQCCTTRDRLLKCWREFSNLIAWQRLEQIFTPSCFVVESANLILTSEDYVLQSTTSLARSTLLFFNLLFWFPWGEQISTSHVTSHQLDLKR